MKDKMLGEAAYLMMLEEEDLLRQMVSGVPCVP